jgi:putative acetyltransferase
MLCIRSEQPQDSGPIDAVHLAAFPSDAEARLVSLLRKNGHASVSLVCEIGGRVVGHILFSPVEIAGKTSNSSGLGLAPLAVLPEFQRMGIGSSLVTAGLAACRQSGCGFVVVLGHPEYYPRFGFRKASRLGLSNEYQADEAFMVIELVSGSLPPAGGLVRYGPEFAELESAPSSNDQ